MAICQPKVYGPELRPMVLGDYFVADYCLAAATHSLLATDYYAAGLNGSVPADCRLVHNVS